MFLRVITFLLIAGAAQAQDLRLWYTKPAQVWEEALPLGSGRMGAMVFGGVVEERIQFNEDTLWTGKPHDYVREGVREHLEEIRKLLFEGKAQEAAPIVRQKFLSDPVRQKAYQPFGDVRLTFPGHEAFTDYRRELDLERAIARTTYRVDGVTFSREVFASYPDNVIVTRVAADTSGRLNFKVRMDSPHKDSKTTVVGDTLVLSGQVQDPTAGNEPGLRFESRLHVQTTGGRVTSDEKSLQVEGADSATLRLVAATSFVSFQDISGDPARRCEEYLAKTGDKPFESLLAAHVADHRKLFGRVKLDLGTSDAAKFPTDERVRRVARSDDDPALAALYFQFGRYMLIASSRPGTQAANLQGVWNELLNPPWEGKYTTNINVEMNYWPAEVANLSECHQPLFDLIDDCRISGARTAQKQYGARGWVVHHNTDLWRGTAPINNIDGMWPTGAAWLCDHLWQHFQFTGDTQFLAKRAYPAMKEASQFFLDFLLKDPKTGYLVTTPTHSPEQGPLTYGTAMDMQLIRALFDHTSEAATILNLDSKFVAQLKATRAQLVPDQVGKHGQLQEWIDDVDQPNNAHRHMSPLWGLYPGDNLIGDPKVFYAAKVLLKWRGDGSTGWSYAWRMPLWARVNDGEMAYRQLNLQLARRTFPNLFDKCGPFQVDGNFGACAGIAEMLVQSHVRDPKTGAYEIDLLPALPKAWPRGLITQLRARGGFSVDIEWDNGRLTKAVIDSSLGLPYRVRFANQVRELKTEAGGKYIIE